MSFQFQCPRGHLLEGDPSQAGQAVNCPTCGMLFVIPDPLPEPAQEQVSFAPAFGPSGEQAPSRFAHLAAMEPPAAVPAAVEAMAGVAEAPAEPAPPEVLHIPCPNGHELETPLDMLDQEVLCPQCHAQFRLRRKDSVEYKRRKQETERIKEIQTENLWLNIAIVAAVLVGLLVVGLIALSVMGRTPGAPAKTKKAASASISRP